LGIFSILKDIKEIGLIIPFFIRYFDYLTNLSIVRPFHQVFKKHKIQAYRFRLSVKARPENKIGYNKYDFGFTT